MLSLSPRFDLFRIVLPKEFLPEPIEKKYSELLSKNPSVVNTPIDYLNESIVGVSFPSISDINTIQEQHGSNSLKKTNKHSSDSLGKINTEPKHEIIYTSTENPLEKISKEVKMTFRLNQGCYNYFMIYETIFYKICKPLLYPSIDVLCLDLLSETGRFITRVKFFDCMIDGIEGLEFDYTKTERNVTSFDVTFKFNNIDFDFLEVD